MQAPLNRQQDPTTVIATKSLHFSCMKYGIFSLISENGEVWTDNDFVAFASNKISIHTRDHLTRCLTDCGCCLRHQTSVQHANSINQVILVCFL